MTRIVDEDFSDQPPLRPCIAEQRKQLAENGDFEAIEDIILTSLPGMISLEEVFQLLLRAVTVRSQQDPAGFTATMLDRMFSFTSYLLFRSHLYTTKMIARYDRSGRGLTGEFPRELESVLPRLLELQSHLAEIGLAQASTARLWELARAKKQENDLITATARTEGGHNGNSISRPKNTTHE